MTAGFGNWSDRNFGFIVLEKNTLFNLLAESELLISVCIMEESHEKIYIRK